MTVLAGSGDDGFRQLFSLVFFITIFVVVQCPMSSKNSWLKQKSESMVAVVLLGPISLLFLEAPLPTRGKDSPILFLHQAGRSTQASKVHFFKPMSIADETATYVLKCLSQKPHLDSACLVALAVEGLRTYSAFALLCTPLRTTAGSWQSNFFFGFAVFARTNAAHFFRTDGLGICLNRRRHDGCDRF
ncbi:unnamed protein product [Symbiodinium sp. CCMP2456]|nr:unnamed protein product [Symbiodinium sp. CCMP2456]